MNKNYVRDASLRLPANPVMLEIASATPSVCRPKKLRLLKTGIMTACVSDVCMSSKTSMFSLEKNFCSMATNEKYPGK